MHKILLAGALLACAGVVSAQSAPVDEPEEAARASKSKASDRYCIQGTGSRIVATRNARNRAEERECVAGNGRVYSRSDIERTGDVDLGDALRRLDPSIN